MRVVAILLLTVFGLFLLYSLFVHPVNKLKLRLLLTKNVTMKIQASYGEQHETVIVKVDGNLIAVGDSQFEPIHYTYYKIEQDTIYAYNEFTADWEPQDQSLLAGSEEFRQLFIADNYKRVKGRLRTWQLKEDVRIDGMQNVRFQRKAGKFTISYQNGLVSCSIVFEKFGRSSIALPGEE